MTGTQDCSAPPSSDDVGRHVQDTYKTIHLVNYHLSEMARMDRSGGRNGAFASTQAVCNALRGGLVHALPPTIAGLELALGRL